MKFGINIGPKVTVSECVSLATYAEQAGFDYVWVADHCPASLYRDPFVTLGSIANATSRVKLGQAVSNPYSRHPALLASAIATLDEVSNGRALLGLGAGGTNSLMPIGVTMWTEPSRILRDAILALRKIFAGESVTLDNSTFMMRNVSLEFCERQIPIYLGARGKKMLRLVGELADGGLVSAYPAENLPSTLAEVEKGAITAGRSLSQVDLAVLITTSLSTDEREALEAARTNAAYKICDSPSQMVADAGLSLANQQRIQNAYRTGGVKAAAELVSDSMVDALSVSGTYDKALEKCVQYLKKGARQLVFSQPFGPNPREGLKILARIINQIREDW